MIFLSFFFAIQTSSKSLSYSISSPVPILIDEIGIPNKPLTYTTFSSFQCCQSSNQPSQSFFDLFIGHKKIDVGISAKFGRDMSTTQFCSQKLTEQQFNLLTNAIQNNFSYRFVADDLTFFAPIGKLDNGYNLQYYSEFSFNFLYNDNNIARLTVSVSDSSLKQIQFKGNYDLSFNVKWEKTSINGKSRFDNFYISYLFMNKTIQTKIKLQLFIQLLFLFVIVYLIYNQMMADFDITNQSLIDFDDFEQKTKDKGWKMLHGDIFRSPEHTSLFSMLISSSSQYFNIVLFTLILCSLCNFTSGIEKVEDSKIKIIFYMFLFTSFIDGFTATTLSSSFGIRQFLRVVLASSYLFTSLFECLLLLSNFFRGKEISIMSIIIFVIIMFLPVSIISTFGGIIARRKNIMSKNPCQVALVPRQLPKLPWYLNNFFVCVLIGLFVAISFSSELFFVLQSVFLDQVFNHYFSLLINFILICVISASAISIAVYFRLQEEYYKWHWISFLAPFSSSVFTLAFCIGFYFYYEVGNSSFQFISFICSSSILCLIFGLAVGFAGHIGTNFFVRLVFSNLKLD